MPKPIFVVTADVHIHPHPHGNVYDSQGRSSRVMLTIEALRQPLKMARELNVPLWILGDLLHDKHHVPVEVIKPLLELRAEFRSVQVNLLVGNHERPDKFSTVNTLSWLDDENQWEVFPDVVKVSAARGEIDVYTMPWYADPTEACALLRQMVSEADQTTPRILLGHGCVDGALSDNGFKLSNPRLTPDALWLQSFNLVLFGDIHKHQSITENGRGWYVGALHPQNFGERHNPSSFMVVNDDFTFSRITIEGGPVFEYTDTVEQTEPTHAYHFVKPSPEAVASASLAGHQGMRLEMDTTDLESMIAAYMTAYPPPTGAGANVASVVAAVQEALR